MDSKIKISLGFGEVLGGSLSSVLSGVGMAGRVWPVCSDGIGGCHYEASQCLSGTGCLKDQENYD